MSTATAQREAFEHLHPKVQHLLTDVLSWRTLRPVQAAAIPLVVAGQRDVLIVSTTASGKTEAAWLPALSTILGDVRAGLSIVGVSPLKALIDDQRTRLEHYGAHLGVSVGAWHGDVSHTKKTRWLKHPPRTLLITPESLQGLLVRRPPELPELLRDLRFVVIDEVHAFAGTDRGSQLQAVLDGVEELVGRRIPRIALSATVSDLISMARFIRPTAPDAVEVVQVGGASSSNIDVLVAGHTRTAPSVATASHLHAGDDLEVRLTAEGQQLDIARAVDQRTRGRRSLVFGSSRASVEEMCLLLKDRQVTGTAKAERYFAHHGSLATGERRAAERAMQVEIDTVIVATSTLELGVDLPNLDVVVQLGSPSSAAALRQRLGRSGRREGTRPSLQVHVVEDSLEAAGQRQGAERISSLLRSNLVESAAVVELIRSAGWVEPPDMQPLNLSTLVQQVLVRCCGGGSSAASMYDALCARGPWDRITANQFGLFLQHLARKGLVRQGRGALIVLGEAGHEVVGRRDFVTAFSTPAEYIVRHGDSEVGTLPVTHRVAEGSSFSLAGRSWKVVKVYEAGWTIDVVPHPSGKVPKYLGGFGRVHRRVRQEMRSIYGRDIDLNYLDTAGHQQLIEGQATFSSLGLDASSVVNTPEGTFIALWTGDRELQTVARWWSSAHPGTPVDANAVGVLIAEDEAPVKRALSAMLMSGPPSLESLNSGSVNTNFGKFDHYLPDDLKLLDHSLRSFDVTSAHRTLQAALGSRP
ncbi:DEAD/DEAH box helicase [Kineococcus sp. SYSU DK004]|uniref:DEAD/DEAH box helicase n=1 Tax=Kineococcus sp. SYSU DK004 TaxID=3383125 RepID=UPI003D7D87E6